MLSATIVASLVDKLQHVNGGLVYLLVTLLVFVEVALFIGFIFPGETAVIIAGVVASQGRVNVVLVCALVMAAAIAGNIVGYAIGSRYGERLLTLSLLKRRRVALDRALEGLRRRGAIYVFVGRFTAFLRAVMPALAGLSRLNYRRFLIATISSAVVWGIGYTLLGYFAGSALNSVEKYSGWAGAALLLAMICFFVIYHFARKRRSYTSQSR
jgi:membrane protein DedA with SNARE-associated domain